MTGFQPKRQASKDLLEPQAQPAANEWREAVDNELVCLHLGTADSFPTAQAALDALINWHIATALDPAVSSAAQALVDRGRAVAEPLIDEMDAVASKYAHKLALDLECVLSDYNGGGRWWSTAMNTIGEYRSAMNRIHERESPTFMGEPVVRNRTSEPDMGNPISPMTEPLTDAQISGAVARGWCHPRNKFKLVDADLALAIAAEVSALIDAHGIKRSAA